MTVILTAAALLCGVPLGVIIGLVLGARVFRDAIKVEDEFDGGFNANNPPRVRSTIWFGEEDR